jgi:hypothetical protein
MLLFISKLRKFPNAAFPRSFNEKLLWRKVFDRNPLYGTMTDKLAARDFVRQLVPELHHPRVFWSGDKIADMPADILNSPCVLKTNRGSGWNLFNWTSNSISKERVVEYFLPIANRAYGVEKGEWTYGLFEQTFFAEELLVGPDGQVPDDYKFHTFGGTVLLCSVIHDRFGNRRQIGVDRDWQLSDTVWAAYGNDFRPEFNSLHHGMIEIVERLAAGTDYLRVDLYVHEGRLYFGEFTFFPGSGLSLRNVGLMELRRNAHWDLSRSSFFTAGEAGWRRRYRQLLTEDLHRAKRRAEDYAAQQGIPH